MKEFSYYETLKDRYSRENGLSDELSMINEGLKMFVTYLGVTFPELREVTFEVSNRGEETYLIKNIKGKKKCEKKMFITPNNRNDLRQRILDTINHDSFIALITTEW